MGNKSSKEQIPEEAPKFSDFLQEFNTDARVSRIIDGDTMEVIFKLNDKYYTFRCNLEVDTYEVRGGTEETKLLGKKAKKFLEDLIQGEIVHVYCKNLDFLGRIVVRMTYQGKDVSKLLETNGFVV